jgi:polyisoprenoid-binding protein YceI
MSWTIDFSHSDINFKVRHMMISQVHGYFERFSGSVNFDETNPSSTTIDIAIEAASINTNDAKRDGHLRSLDFLNTDEFPSLTFKSRRVELIDDNNANLFGDLTIRGVTRPVTLKVEYLGQAKSPWGSINAGFFASTRISRKDWDLSWNVALETGGWLVGDSIDISVELELVKIPEAVAVA